MNKISTIGELRKAIEGYSDDDIVLVEIHEGVRNEDLYRFHIDEIDINNSQSGDKFTEVRFCI